MTTVGDDAGRGAVRDAWPDDSDRGASTDAEHGAGPDDVVSRGTGPDLVGGRVPEAADDVVTPIAAPETWDAVVVGAGVAGLVAARDLARAGLRTLVLDGRDAPGGAVRGHTVAGLRLDAGAESFATRGGVVAAFLDELGLTSRVVAPEPRGSWVHLPSGDGPLPRTGLLGIPSEPGAADVRRTLGVLGSWRARLDLVLPARIGASATSLGGLVRARMGRRVVDRLVRPIVGGVHAADPFDLAVGAVSPGLPDALRASGGSLARAVARLRAAAPAGSAVLGIDGGMHVLVDALVADLASTGGTLRTNALVTEVSRNDDWHVTVVREGTPVVVRAPRLVLATPAAAGLLRPPSALGAPGPATGRPAVTTDSDTHHGVPDPRSATGTAGRPPSARPTTGSQTYPEPLTLGPSATDDDRAVLDPGAVVTLVTLVLDEPALDAAPRGTGVLVTPAATDVTAKALTHATAKWGWLATAAGPGRHVVRLSFGRAGDDPGTLPSSEAALVDLALRDAATLLGVPLRADRLVGHAVVRWTEALPRPSAAHRWAVEQVRDTARDLPGLAVCGAWAAGNGLASVIPDARAAARSLL